MPRYRRRHPDAVLRRHDHAEERVSTVRGRRRGFAGAGARVLATVGARDGRPHTFRTGRPRPTDGVGVPRFIRRPLAHGARGGMERRVRRRRRPLRRPSGDRRPAGEDRQRPLRARLLQVHPLLPVRRRVWGAVAAELRHRDRRPRIRRTRLHRERRATSGVGVRVLRQLHPGVPDGGADADHRVRPSGGRDVGPRATEHHRDDLRLLRCRMRARPARAGRPDREGRLTRRQSDHARQPLHQGPLRIPARPASPRRDIRVAQPSHRWTGRARVRTGVPASRR